MTFKIECPLQREDLIFVPLGGSGEIGMNCNLYHFEGKWLMVDLGITFRDERIENADLVMPDLKFINERKEDLCGIILTHAHEDHIGAMPYLYENFHSTPIYTTSFTASVLKRKFNNTINHGQEINLLKYNSRFNLGPFEIEILALTHSIPEPNAVIIRTSKGNVFHTGDWKIDPKPLVGKAIDENKLKKISNEGINAMVCDSTNVFNEKMSGSENDVRESFKKIFNHQKNGKIIITCFASNIARLETILVIAEEFGRSCVLVGRSLKRIYESAVENDYLTNFKSFLSEKDAKSISDENLVLICTGSQGESRAALFKLVNHKNQNFQIYGEDLVIFSSREIPGNETKINSLKNELRKIGCRFLDHKNSMVHVSGHPSKSELNQMYKWVKPDVLIPVHGEYQHLSEHAKFALECGINSSILIENGDVVLIDKQNKSKKISKVYSGRLFLKGSRILPLEKKIFSNLNIISSDGDLNIVLIMNVDDNLIINPIISSHTFLDEDDDSDKNKIINYLTKLLNEMLEDNFNFVLAEDFIKKKVRNFIKKEYGIKPLTNVKLVRI